MIIKGFQATSLLDYPGNIASIVFTPGCNFRCPYCYNKDLVFNSKNLLELDEEKILAQIEKRKKLIDGVVISGGEPCLQKDLPIFVKKIKDLGLKVKLDTNGTNPDLVAKLISEKLVDFIAMDIKGSLEKYSEITNSNPDLESIKESVNIIMRSDVDYEFRSTVLPNFFSNEDFIKIGEWLKGAKKYCLQQFKTIPGMIDSSFSDKKTFSKEELQIISESLKDYFDKVEIRV